MPVVVTLGVAFVVALLLVALVVAAVVAVTGVALVVPFSSARSFSRAVVVSVFSAGRVAVVRTWGGGPLRVAVLCSVFARVVGRIGILP